MSALPPEADMPHRRHLVWDCRHHSVASLGPFRTPLTRRSGSAAFDSTIGAGVTWHGKAPDGERGPGLLRFRMGGTSDGRECRHHHVGVVAVM